MWNLSIQLHEVALFFPLFGFKQVSGASVNFMIFICLENDMDLQFGLYAIEYSHNIITIRSRLDDLNFTLGI
jgi:hypothetical protein